MRNCFKNKSLALGRMLITLFFLSTSIPLAASEHEGKGAAPANQPIQFVLNVGKTAASMRFLRVDVVLDYASPDAAARFAKIKPKLSHRILLALSGLEQDVLQSVRGKREIQESIRSDLNTLLGETSKTGIKEVYFTEFLFQ